MGDGVLVYFGYPQTPEDDAERAVRAGLGCIDAVGRLDVKSAKLQARVGIATGLVVVGDLIGAGSAQEQSVVGETPNLAARLQALAQPDAVVIAAATRRLVGWFAAELNRHKGQLLLCQGHSEAAEKLYRKALSIAEEPEAKLWQLRAAVQSRPTPPRPRAASLKPATFWNQSTTGLPKGLTHPISKKQERCSRSYFTMGQQPTNCFSAVPPLAMQPAWRYRVH